MSTVPPEGTHASAVPDIQGRLGLAFQEPLTVAARIRRNQFHAPHAGEFRRHLLHLLGQADAATRQAGYASDFAKLGTYAVVALLDESILNSPGPLKAEWVGYPLQQELFGENVAGENFFLQLRDLLARPDSRDLADILEVFLLCLLLGFKGRYAASDGAEIQGLVTATLQKIHRTRVGRGVSANPARLPEGEVPPKREDPWIPRLVRATLVAFVVAVLLLIGFALLLWSGNGEVGDLVYRMTL